MSSGGLQSINNERLREAIRDGYERGVDVQLLIEEESVDYKMAMTRIRGVNVGINVIAFAFLLIVGSEILASFKGVKMNLDFQIISVTTSALAGLFGYAIGNKRKK